MRALLEPSYKAIPKLLPCLLTLGLVTVTSEHAFCAAAAVSKPARTIVQVSLVGRAGSDRTLANRISSWFDQKQFRVITTTIPRMQAERVLAPEAPGTLYVWVSLKGNHGARLYFATTPNSTRKSVFLVRELPLTDGLDELGAERIGQVLHLSTVAIVDGQVQSQRNLVERKLREEEAKPGAADSLLFTTSTLPTREGAAASERPPPAEPFARKLEIGVGYGLSLRGDEGVWHGPRLSLAYRWTRPLTVGAILRSAFPTSNDVEGVTLSVKAMGAAAFVGWRALEISWASVVVYAGPGLEVVQYHPTRTRDPDLTLLPSQTETRPNLLAGASLSFGRDAPRGALCFEVTALFSPRSYELVAQHRHNVSAHAADVSPNIAIELRF